MHVPIYVAEAKGYFRREGLDVSIRLPAQVTDPIKLVAANPMNYLGIGYMSDVVSAEDQGIPVESIAALVQHHLNCIMTLKSSGITSPRQLAGKSIGAAGTPTDNLILDTVFRHAGVTGQVRRVNINYNYVQALVGGQVSAIEGGYQVWERIEIEQKHRQVNVIQLHNWGVPDEYELVLLAGRQMVSHNPSVLRRFMKAVSLGEQFAVRQPAVAVRMFFGQNPRDKSPEHETLVTRSWRLLIPFVQPAGVAFGSQSPGRWHSLAAWMYRNRLITRVIPNGRLFTDRFVP
ncbi:MAG TPA: ABC transporter substrate-binding protein [Chloroflexota bacterium]|nr:ABC transporter substrate-binding protein [Chloroflexota bacterium]